MVGLERNVLPMLPQYMASWKQYVVDSISYVKVDCIKQVLNGCKYFLYLQVRM